VDSSGKLEDPTKLQIIGTFMAGEGTACGFAGHQFYKAEVVILRRWRLEAGNEDVNCDEVASEFHYACSSFLEVITTSRVMLVYIRF
jgi:hypothetical protein